MIIIGLALAALTLAAHALHRARLRREEALHSGMFDGLADEIAALAAVPVLPIRATIYPVVRVPEVRLAA